MADVYSLTIRADTRDVSRAKQALDGLSSGAIKAQRTTGQLATSATRANRSFKPMRGAVQQLGFQVQDLAVQLSAGTSAFVAFGQQGPQIASIFGPGGAVVGAIFAVAAAIGGTLFNALSKTDEETKDYIDRLEDLELAYDDLTSAQKAYLGVLKEVSQAEFDQQVEESESRIKSLEQTLDAFRRGVQVRRGPNGPLEDLVSPEQAEAARSELLRLRAEIDALGQEAEKTAERYDNLTFGFGEGEESARKQADQLSELVREIERQGETVGMTARETAIYEANRLGATQADRNAINAAFDLIDAQQRLDAQQKALMESTKISAVDDPILQRIEAQRRAQELLAEESAVWAQKIAQNQQTIQQQSVATVGASIGAMQSFFEQGSSEFIAFGLLQKAVMAGQAVMAANLAATLALTAQVPGDPTGPARAIAQAETIRTLGYINAGLILATGIGEAIQSASADGSRQLGGSVSAGGRYLVGENGPEVVTMGGSGVVTPSSVMGGSESGNDVIVNVNNAPPGTRTEERRDSEGRRFVDVFISDLGTGGPMAKSIQNTFGVRRQGR